MRSVAVLEASTYGGQGPNNLAKQCSTIYVLERWCIGLDQGTGHVGDCQKTRRVWRAVRYEGGKELEYGGHQARWKASLRFGHEIVQDWDGITVQHSRPRRIAFPRLRIFDLAG